MLGILIADESQYCVSKEYFMEIVANTARSKQFYTATEKHVTTTDLGRGLNNETVFGPLIVEKNPQELIDSGDTIAINIYNEYDQSPMLPNDLSEIEMEELILYLSEKK